MRLSWCSGQRDRLSRDAAGVRVVMRFLLGGDRVAERIADLTRESDPHTKDEAIDRHVPAWQQSAGAIILWTVRWYCR